MAWNITSDRPVFIQIMEKIKLDIITGVYKPGDKLPSVRDLASEAAVNPNTMQKAMAELEREELVFSQRTSGRYITEDQTMIENLKEQMAQDTIATFLENMKKLGFDQGTTIQLVQNAMKGEE